MTPSDSSQHVLAELRHDLANPLNHLLGFTELLMQSAREVNAQQNIQAGLDEITRAAAEVRRHLDEQLGTARIRAKHVDIHALRTGISEGTQLILAQVEALRPLTGLWQEAVTDLEEVRIAATRLRQMVAAGSLERVLEKAVPGPEGQR